MSSENLDIEIAKENVSFSYKSGGSIPVNAGSKETAPGECATCAPQSREINIKIDKKGDNNDAINMINNFQSNITFGLSVFMICATFGIISRNL
jgi:hypothetical protein